MVAEESRKERPLSLREWEEVQEVPWPGLTNATSAGVRWCSIAEYVWRREAGDGGAPIHHDSQIDILGPVERGGKTWEEIGELGGLLVGAQRDDPRQDVVERLVHLLRE